MPFDWGINNLLTIPALLFPTSLGMPETLDIAKSFGRDLFDIKFGGGIVFILSLIACFNNRAPREAKILFIVSFVSCCTPLNTYLYSRSTLVMAIGMAWLAAWQLNDLTINQYKKQNLRRIIFLLLAVTALWLAASAVCYCLKAPITELLQQYVESKTALSHIGRDDGQSIRTERFIDRVLIWDWRNLLLCSGLLVGSYCLWLIKSKKTTAYKFAASY